MARPTEWRRTTFVQDSLGYYGYSPGIAVQPGETVIRTLWSLQVWNVYGASTTYPPGTSLLRAGIIFDSFASPRHDTPVSQAFSDWMDLTTIPWNVELQEAVNADWLIRASTGQGDRDSRAMRKNDTAEPMTVWVSWEIATSAWQIADFGFYTCGSTDMLIALAP